MTWHHRRLPHLYGIDQPIFLTWRLHGSLPANRIFPPETTSGEAFVAMDRLLDRAREGPMYLRRPEVAQMIVGALLHREQHLRHFELHHWVVMPNHIHVLITPRVAVSKLVHSLKLRTALEGNRLLGLTGQPFWQDESYDRLVRNAEEFQKIAKYIEENPVSAGLVAAPEEFPWSSARPIGNRPQVKQPAPQG